MTENFLLNNSSWKSNKEKPQFVLNPHKLSDCCRIIFRKSFLLLFSFYKNFTYLQSFFIYLNLTERFLHSHYNKTSKVLLYAHLCVISKCNLKWLRCQEACVWASDNVFHCGVHKSFFAFSFSLLIFSFFFVCCTFSFCIWAFWVGKS